MISKFLLDAYDSLTELALWLLFISAAIAGYLSAGIEGSLFALITAGIAAIFLVAPFMMISDIRRTVARIEANRATVPNATRNYVTSPVGANPETPPTQKESSMTSAKSWGRVKNYKGYEITRADGKVFVGDHQFDGVIKAEQFIDKNPKV